EVDPPSDRCDLPPDWSVGSPQTIQLAVIIERSQTGCTTVCHPINGLIIASIVQFVSAQSNTCIIGGELTIFSVVATHQIFGDIICGLHNGSIPEISNPTR